MQIVIKGTNFHKLGPLSKAFQTVWKEAEDGKFVWGELFYWVVGIWQGVIFTTQTFSKAKNNIL